MTTINEKRTINLGKMQPFDEKLNKPDKAVALKVLEEGAECTEAAKLLVKHIAKRDDDQCDYSITEEKRLRTDMLDEAADVMQTLANLFAAFDVTEDEISEAKERVYQRNVARGRITQK